MANGFAIFAAATAAAAVVLCMHAGSWSLVFLFSQQHQLLLLLHSHSHVHARMHTGFIRIRMLIHAGICMRVILNLVTTYRSNIMVVCISHILALVCDSCSTTKITNKNDFQPPHAILKIVRVQLCMENSHSERNKHRKPNNFTIDRRHRYLQAPHMAPLSST